MKIPTNKRYKKIRVNGRTIDEHRYVMEQHLGRYLQTWECVRHLNGNSRDNRLENLYLTNKKRVPYEQIVEGSLVFIDGKGKKKSNEIILKKYGKKVLIAN